jgi:glucokinase
MLLVGDIGGTKTSLAIFAGLTQDDPLIAEATLKSIEFESFERLLSEFFTLNPVKVEYAAFGVPGPVIDGTVKTTNLPWMIKEDDLESTLDANNAWLLNDLEATASAVPFLQSSDLLTLQDGQTNSTGAKAVIAPGTGLGEAYLTQKDGVYQAHPTEGGHVDFAPTTALQQELLAFLLEDYDHVSYERLCSGMGLPNIYRFFKERKKIDEPSWLSDEISREDDATPLIVNAALNDDPECEICRMTLDLFVEILGAECGNLALQYLATGGVYIAGGMIPKMLPGINRNRFLETVANKGRFSDFMTKIPIYLILNPRVALIGARQFALQKLSTN